MDGNGRWAVARGLPRADGHRAGADAVRRVVEAAPDLGIGTLSLFAFSSDNWKRPEDEVPILMGLFAQFLRDEADPLARPRRAPVRHRAPRSAALQRGLRRSRPPRRSTARANRLHLRLAVDYSSRDAILRRGAVSAARDRPTRESFAQRLDEAHGAPGARRGPADPHRRRAAPERLPPVGERLRRALLHGAHVARLPRRRTSRPPSPSSGRRDRRFGALSESGKR